jgi:hypothetical protein
MTTVLLCADPAQYHRAVQDDICRAVVPTVNLHTKKSNDFSHLSIRRPEGDTRFTLLMTVLQYACLTVVMDSCPAQMLALPGRLMEQPQRCFSFIDLHLNTIYTCVLISTSLKARFQICILSDKNKAA